MMISNGRRFKLFGSETCWPVSGLMSGDKVGTTCGLAVGAAVGSGVTVGGKVGLMIGSGVLVGRGVNAIGVADPQAASRTIGITSKTDRVSCATKFVIDMLCSVS